MTYVMWEETSYIDMGSRFLKKFSSMDFEYTKEKEYYFIENNCNGQWIWFENVTGVDMSSVFIRSLLDSGK